MTRSFKEIKSAIAWQLKESIGEDRFDLWFGSEDSFAIQDGQVTVSAIDELSLAFLQQQFGTCINDAVRAALGPGTLVQYVGNNTRATGKKQNSLFTDEQLDGAGVASKPEKSAGGRRKGAAGRVQARHDSNGRSLFAASADNPCERGSAATVPTLDNFDFGSDNVLLETAVRQMLAQPGKFNPLFLSGPVGCGKSHLLQSMIALARQGNHYQRCVHVTSEQFTTGFIEALQNKTLTSFRSRYRNLDLLAIDDVQFLVGKEATLVEFHNTIETLLKNSRQVIVTADRPVFHLNLANEQLVTRLACGLACPVAYPDMQARQRIVHRLAESRQLELPGDVEQYICERIGRDVRMLMGAVNRLKTAALALGKKIDTANTQELLADLFHSQNPVVSLTLIERVICDHCGVDSAELKSGKRIKRISTARMLAMWLSRKHTSAGLAEIGNYYGGRSHSTVISAEKKIERLLQTDEPIDLKSRRTSIQAAISQFEHCLQTG